jgi:oxygen-dependent protoporphyrinogen oxidase
VTYSVAVIGGGVSGATAAWELRRQLGPEASITVLEAYDRLGGKLKTVDFADGPVDMGAEAFLTRRTGLDEIIREVGLADRLRVPSGLPSGFFSDGRLVDAPAHTVMGIPARGTDVAGLVSTGTADRIDAEGGAPALDWTPGGDINVGDLVRDRYGDEAVQRLVSPMLGGVYSSSADDLGLRATVPDLAQEFDALASAGDSVHLSTAVTRILDRRAGAAQRQRATGAAPTPAFNALSTGYRDLIRRLATVSEADIRLNSQVEAVSRWQGGYWLEPFGQFDAVVVATPAPTAAVLLQDVAPQAASRLDRIQLASSAVVGMRFATDDGLPRRSGVLLGSDAPTHAKAFTFSSRKWPHIAERGGAFVRASFGTLRDPGLLEADDETLIGYAVEDLATVTGATMHPVETFVQRWWGGLPSYGVGHRRLVDGVRDAVGRTPGIAVAGAVFDGVGVPACAASGRAAATKIIADLGNVAGNDSPR